MCTYINHNWSVTVYNAFFKITENRPAHIASKVECTRKKEEKKIETF